MKRFSSLKGIFIESLCPSSVTFALINVTKSLTNPWQTMSQTFQSTANFATLKISCVTGTLKEKLQKNVLETEHLDFARVLKISHAADAAAKLCKELHNNATSAAPINNQGQQWHKQQHRKVDIDKPKKQCSGYGGNHSSSSQSLRQV